MTPTESELFEAMDATWRPFRTLRFGKWTLREGKGGGKRVSAASSSDSATTDDVRAAETEMGRLGQIPLFMIRDHQQALDRLLESLGYAIIDPVDILIAKSGDLADYDQPKLEVIFTPEPIAILAEIWAEGGIYQSRLDVMRRVKGAKTCLLGRFENKPVAAAFVATHGDTALVHAVEVRPSARRRGVARRLLNGAAWWAQESGVRYIGCLTTSENSPAQNLYRNMGMEVAAHYHYRIKRP